MMKKAYLKKIYIYIKYLTFYLPRQHFSFILPWSTTTIKTKTNTEKWFRNVLYKHKMYFGKARLLKWKWTKNI